MKNRLLKKYCLYCDGEYTAQRADSRYCSGSCRQMASRSRCRGGIGYRVNYNSLPRDERQTEIVAPNSSAAVNQVSTQVASNSNNRQLSVNNSSISDSKPSINRQPIVNKQFEKLKLEVEKMKIESEISKKYESELIEREKKRLLAELQKLLKLSKIEETSLSKLRFIVDSIYGILIAQKDIFKDTPKSYDFLLGEFVPKLKKLILKQKRKGQRIFSFNISSEIEEKIIAIINEAKLSDFSPLHPQ